MIGSSRREVDRPMNLKYLHCADLHLDSPFQGFQKLEPWLAERCRRAARQAWQNLLELAETEQVDFLLVAGDVYDGAERRLQAQLAFQEGVQRLAARGIHSYVVHGNHDPLDGRLGTLRFPEEVTIFPGGSVSSAVYRRDGEALARIHGISYPTRNPPPAFGSGFLRRGDEPWQIGLFHCTVGSHGDHEPYAPRTLAELAASDLDYWALGHIHLPGVLQDRNPTVVYPGCLQGRHARECGPRGCYLVDVREGAIERLDFVELDDLRWVAAEVDLAGVESMDEVRDRANAACEALRGGAQGRPLLVRLRLAGRTALCREIRQGGEDLAEFLRERHGEGSDFVWVERLDLAVRPALDLEGRALDPGLVGEVLRQHAGFTEQEARAALADLWERPMARRVLPELKPAWLRDCLDEALVLAAESLEED